MVAVFSPADATIVAAAIVTFGAPLAIMLRRVGRDVRQINRAVNHAGDGEPPMIQRVRDMEIDQCAHRRWTAEAMKLIGTQLGVTIPDPPPHRSKCECGNHQEAA